MSFFTQDNTDWGTTDPTPEAAALLDDTRVRFERRSCTQADLQGDFELTHWLTLTAGGTYGRTKAEQYRPLYPADFGAPYLRDVTESYAGFAQASLRMAQAQAALQVADIDEGVREAVRLAVAPDRNAWVERALGFAAAHRGAAELMAREILALRRRGG